MCAFWQHVGQALLRVHSTVYTAAARRSFSSEPADLQATHIFDGLEQWPTHLMYLSKGRLQVAKEAHEIPELADDHLLELVEG